MSTQTPESHDLRRLFRATFEKAFQENASLYSPGVAVHLSGVGATVKG